VDTDSFRIPKLRLRGLSPEKNNLLLHQQTPVFPIKRAYNTEFTGRTFSEREQALKDKAKGLPVTPLPERKIHEVPWIKGEVSWKPSWEIAEELADKSGKNVRKLTDEEKALLSSARATPGCTRALFATPLMTAKAAVSTTLKSVFKETQALTKTTKHGALAELRASNTQETASLAAKGAAKEPQIPTKASVPGYLRKPTTSNAQQAGLSITARTSINPSSNMARTAPDSESPTSLSVHAEGVVGVSPNMTLTAFNSASHTTASGEIEGGADAVCVPDALPEDLPHYELIIWRTFAPKGDARGNHTTPKTRKVSFPITQEFAAKIAAGQNLTFINNLNTLLEGTQNKLALLIPLSTGSDGMPFPPAFTEIAEQQFADIVGELVRFQEGGYGRWSLDSLRRRVAIDDAAFAPGLGPHLEAVIVIRMTGFTKKGWLGLPGYDADGNLRLSPPGMFPLDNDDIGSSGGSWSGSSPATTMESVCAGDESGLVDVGLRNKVKKYAGTPCPSVLQTATTVATRAGDLPEGNIVSSGSILSKSVNELFNKHKSHTRAYPLPIMSTPNVVERSAEIRLSISTTPFLPPKSGHKSTQGTIGDGTGMAAWNNYAGEASDPRVKHPATRTGAKFSTPGANASKNDSGSGCIPATATRLERVTIENWSVADAGERVGAPQPDGADSVWCGQNVLTKAQLEVGKTYVSTRNPSNPIPGALLSPGVIDSEPTLRMVLPTPPAKSTARPGLTIHRNNISQQVGEKTANRRNKADLFDALFPANATSSMGSKSGASIIRPPNAPPADLIQKAASRGPPALSKSSQNLNEAGRAETTVVRHRWEFATTASLAKGRPPSPVKARSHSPVKNKKPWTSSISGSPVKRSTSPVKTIYAATGLGAAQPTVSSVARAASVIKPGTDSKQNSGNATATATTRPKSRAARMEGSQSVRPRSRAGSATRGTGTLSRYGTANVRTLRLDGVANGGVVDDGDI